MITPSYGLTATERVLPKLALDFTTAVLDPRVTFTRATTATYFDSNKVMQIAAIDSPRFDYNPVSGASLGFLIEEQRTNLRVYSEDLTNVIAWGGATPPTITADAGTAPNNTVTADLLNDTSGAAVQGLEGSSVIISGTGTYTASCFIKQGTSNCCSIRVFTNGTTPVVAELVIDPLNGLAQWRTGVTGTAFSITPIGNGWFRCTVTITDNGTAANTISILLRPAFAATYTPTISAAATGSALFWGAQIEAGAFATSYIPTVATSVIRSADVAVMTSTNFSDWYTATTGAAVVWAIPQTATGTRPLIQFDDTTANEIITLRGNVANPELYIVDGGAPQAQIDAGTIVANTVYKLSGAWNTDSCAAAQNGAAAVTDNTATIPTPTQLRIGSDGTNYASAWVQKILYYPQRLTNAEVQAFSK